MRNRLQDALRASKAEYTDIRIEDVTTSQIVFQGQELDSIGSSRTVGGIVRALVKGGWGYSTFNDLEHLDQRVQEACESARLVAQEKTYFAPLAPVLAEIKANMLKDFRQVPLADKKALTEEYNRLVLAYHPKIMTTRVGYGDRFRKTWFATSEGTYMEEEEPQVFIYTFVVARDGDNVQQGIDRNGGSDGYQLVEGFHSRAEATAKRAIDLLSAPPVTGGKYTVVVNPTMAGVFIHEAFGHLSESDFIYENERMKELMQLGKRFASPILNVVDDGFVPGQCGSHPYDMEGTPTQKTYLIKDGILAGRLHSRETAARMGEQPTGNARAVSYLFPPIVRMTNTYIEPGKTSFEEMIKDIPLGLYAVDAFGGTTSMEMFTFSAAYGYMIRNGQLAELVRDVVLTGNVFETLMNIDMLGDKMEWTSEGPGGCGKFGQFPLRVGIGGPHVRIQNVVVGGQQ